jgi:hypothetical protein
MARRRRHVKSRRGGAAAPAHCKRALGKCVTQTIRVGGSMRTAGKLCMKTFNRCRSGRRR